MSSFVHAKYDSNQLQIIGPNDRQNKVLADVVRLTGIPGPGNLVTAVPGFGWSFTAGQWYLTDGSVTSPILNETGLTHLQLESERGKTLSFIPTSPVQSSNGFGVPALPPKAGPAVINIDLLVYDASAAGIFAALRAKAEGVSVMIVAPRDHIGGVPTGAVQFTDVYSVTKYMATIPESSLQRKLMNAQAATYNLNLNQWYANQSASAESKVTKAILIQWLADAGIPVIKNAPVTAVTMNGDPNNGGRIADVTCLGIGKIVPKEVFDSSYQAVISLLAGMTTTRFMGAEATSQYGEGAYVGGYTVAGDQPANFVDPYVIPGDANSGLIKYVQPGALQTPGTEIAGRVQFPGFRINITNTAGKFIPFPEPDNYDPLTYEVYRRDIVANKSAFTRVPDFIQVQVPIPSNTAGMTNKRDGNQKGVFGIDYPDPIGNAAYYSLPTEAERIAYEAGVKQWLLGYWKFHKTHPDVPAAARADFAAWGMCNDDYTENGGFPPIMYPREGFRNKAANTVTGATMFTLNGSTTPVALSIAYAADSHPMFYPVSLNGGPHVISQGTQAANAAKSTLGARIPLAILNCSIANLQSPWAPNCSRVAYNTLRLEPIVCTYSEAGGIRAALAIKAGIALSAVPFDQIAVRQNLYGLDPVGGSVVTFDGVTRTQGTSSVSGTWADVNTTIAGTVSIKNCTATTGTNTFTAAPNPIGAGNCKLQLKYLDHNGAAGDQKRGKFTVVVKGNGVNQASQLIDQNSNDAGVLTNGDWLTVYTGPWVAGDNVVGTYDNNTTSGASGNIVAARVIPA